MRLLLDTHVLLWALATPERLAPAIHDQLEDPANIVLFSAASIWEIAIKARLGRADFPPSPTRVSEAARASGFLELPVPPPPPRAWPPCRCCIATRSTGCWWRRRSASRRFSIPPTGCCRRTPSW
jgi:hypothetical protein